MRPSLAQFHFRMWAFDSRFMILSLSARGLWFQMLNIMVYSDPYGYLKSGKTYLDTKDLASATGAKIDEVTSSLKEILDAELAEQDEEGHIKSSLIINAEETRRRRAAGGRLGGNPSLVVPPDETQSPVAA